MSSNFDFLRAEWSKLHAEAARAERMAQLDPRASCFYARRAVELTVKWIFEYDQSVKQPYETTLNALMHEPTFKKLTGPVFAKMDIIRRQGNHAIHEAKPVSAQSSVGLIRELWHVMFWFAAKYAHGDRPPVGVTFDLAMLPKPGEAKASVEAKTSAQLQRMAADIEGKDADLEAQRATNQSLQSELEQLRAEIAAVKKANEAAPDDHDYDEAATRIAYIDLLLAEAGWELSAGNLEVEVAGMPNDKGVGFVDYVLWGDDGRPLGLIEAKRTSRSATEGQHQAKLYADCLEAAHGQRPVIFYSNGYEHWLWDDVDYPPRTVDGFYTRDELQLLVQRRTTRTKLADSLISSGIAGRTYQQAAIRKIADSFEKDRERKALVVMATGAGKTRTVIALADLLMRNNWAKRVLFLADRIALTNQAANAFKQQLADTPIVNLLKDKRGEGRVYLSTYPTMMGLIDDVADGRRRFSPGHFDLIVIDEAHRSVYQKYRSIFSYFDSLLVGLTATPKEDIDHNTYSLFELQDGVPTAAYGLQEAIADGFLVPAVGKKVGLAFPQQGIHYGDLTPDEQERWDELEWDGGDAPDEVSAEAVNRWLFNTDTVDKVLATLMTEGRHVAGGDRLGKTIIFAKNNDHAQFIAKRFDANYPEYKGSFARVLTYKTEYVQDLIDKFTVADDEPHIAISVDLLDTGIDVPEVVNLVFFKQVRSKTKFWQMIGRGTRLRPDLYGPGEDKADFLVFDVCNNIEFFNADLATGDGASPEPLSQRLFKTRAELVGALDRSQASTSLRTDVSEVLRNYVAAMNTDNFVVRPQRKLVEQYAKADAWAKIGPEAATDLAGPLSGLPSADLDNDEDAKRFDLLVLHTQLDLLNASPGLARRQQQIQQLAAGLLEQTNVPAIKAQQELLEAVAGDEWWIDVTVDLLEKARKNLRALVRLAEKRRRVIVYTDFEDAQTDTEDIELPMRSPAVDFERFKEKARVFLREHQDEIALQRLQRNQQITELDLSTLERLILEHGIGGDADLQRAKDEASGLGLFIRSLIGLEKSAAEEAFAGFIAKYAITSNQIEFIGLVVDQLTFTGVLEVGDLYGAPFTDVAAAGPDSVFAQQEIDSMVTVLTDIRSHAVAS